MTVSPIKPPLTLEALEGAKFYTVMHLNGGTKFSRLSSRNDEWNIGILQETNGRPGFIIQAKEIQDLRKGSDVAVDITPPLEYHEIEAKLIEFVDAYNAQAAT